MKPKPKTPIKLPASHLIALADAGFTVISYLNMAIAVETPDGSTRNEWLPRLCIATGPGSVAPSGKGYRVIEWLPACHPSNVYGFDGWQAHDNHTCGGMSQTILQALGWFEWHEESKRQSLEASR